MFLGARTAQGLGDGATPMFPGGSGTHDCVEALPPDAAVWGSHRKANMALRQPLGRGRLERGNVGASWGVIGWIILATVPKIR